MVACLADVTMASACILAQVEVYMHVVCLGMLGLQFTTCMRPGQCDEAKGKRRADGTEHDETSSVREIAEDGGSQDSETWLRLEDRPSLAAPPTSSPAAVADVDPVAADKNDVKAAKLFDEGNGQIECRYEYYFDLCASAYEQHGSPKFNCKEVVSDRTANLYVMAVCEQNCVVLAFRGSVLASTHGDCNWSNWTDTNANYKPVSLHEKFAVDAHHALVHEGFQTAYIDNLSEKIRSWLERKCYECKTKLTVRCTGHSLGGALATLCAFDLATDDRWTLDELVTVGAPRIGNGDFKRLFQNRTRGLRIYRFCHYHDLVPKFLSRYEHICEPTTLSTMQLNPIEAHKMQEYIQSLNQHLGGREISAPERWYSFFKCNATWIAPFVQRLPQAVGQNWMTNKVAQAVSLGQSLMSLGSGHDEILNQLNAGYHKLEDRIVQQAFGQIQAIEHSTTQIGSLFTEQNSMIMDGLSRLKQISQNQHEIRESQNQLVDSIESLKRKVDDNTTALYRQIARVHPQQKLIDVQSAAREVHARLKFFKSGEDVADQKLHDLRVNVEILFLKLNDKELLGCEFQDIADHLVHAHIILVYAYARQIEIYEELQKLEDKSSNQEWCKNIDVEISNVATDFRTALDGMGNFSKQAAVSTDTRTALDGNFDQSCTFLRSRGLLGVATKPSMHGWIRWSGDVVVQAWKLFPLVLFLVTQFIIWLGWRAQSDVLLLVCSVYFVVMISRMIWQSKATVLVRSFVAAVKTNGLGKRKEKAD